MTPEETLRACQAIVGRFFEHEIEREEAFGMVIGALEAGGYGSIESVVEVANDE